ncbi:MAG: ATP-binding protein, partial [Hyphomicrobiales bacterium]
MSTLENKDQNGPFEPHIIPSRLAITAMRDAGYKNTAYALAELIDNSQQAGASLIEVLSFENREIIKRRQRSRISEIAVLDNGKGMDSETLRMSLQFGNGRYLNDHSGIGRFGMGLPNSSISQAGRVEVWTWQNGYENAIYSYLDIAEIESGGVTLVPQPEHSPVPDKWLKISENDSRTGTLVVWSKLDFDRLTWKSARATLEKTEELAGRIYRKFIIDESIRIRLFAQNEDDEILFDRDAFFNDPLYLTHSTLVPKPFDIEPMFEHFALESHEIEFDGAIHIVTVNYSVAKQKTVEAAGSNNRGDTPYGKHAKKNIGVSVMRAGRELTLDSGWRIIHDPRERWWGAEVTFPPALDKLFGVTNNKQAATHFAELAATEWQQFTEDDEDFMSVVNRLKDEGDPRGFLLELADSIKRTLQQLRERIKAQGTGLRSTRSTRHN